MSYFETARLHFVNLHFSRLYDPVDKDQEDFANIISLLKMQKIIVYQLTLINCILSDIRLVCNYVKQSNIRLRIEGGKPQSWSQFLSLR